MSINMSGLNRDSRFILGPMGLKFLSYTKGILSQLRQRKHACLHKGLLNINSKKSKQTERRSSLFNSKKTDMWHNKELNRLCAPCGFRHFIESSVIQPLLYLLIINCLWQRVLELRLVVSWICNWQSVNYLSCILIEN